jgi:hypothetical protein
MGLMLEKGVKNGHAGEGPGFRAACMHDIANGKTCCAIVSSNEGKNPMEIVMSQISP